MKARTKWVQDAKPRDSLDTKRERWRWSEPEEQIKHIGLRHVERDQEVVVVTETGGKRNSDKSAKQDGNKSAID